MSQDNRLLSGHMSFLAVLLSSKEGHQLRLVSDNDFTFQQAPAETCQFLRSVHLCTESQQLLSVIRVCRASIASKPKLALPIHHP